MLFSQLLYRILTGLLLICALPLLPLMAGKAKYRARLLRRLGFGLKTELNRPAKTIFQGPTIWIHALSVGEVTSALPLVRGLRQQLPGLRLIFSATTRSGSEVAASLLSPLVDHLIAAPLDLGPVVPYYLTCIRPDLFILVETDFWPHWIFCLHQRRIPLMLVNGRISARSFSRYQRLSPIFRLMFAKFSLLSMQTENDAQKMRALGHDPARIATLGNLKFDILDNPRVVAEPGTREHLKRIYGFSPSARLWVCGSTHPGEEALIFQVYVQLRQKFADLQLLLAPRNIERAASIQDLARDLGLPCRRRTTDKDTPGPLLLLDTIGELAGCYAMADLVFIGGSLAPFGGHNPLEPAAAGVPVSFGPHMEDFSEISEELIRSGGAGQVKDAAALAQWLEQLLCDQGARDIMGRRALACVEANHGVVDNHIRLIGRLLSEDNRRR